MSDAKRVVLGVYDAMRKGDVVALVNACAKDVEWRLCGPTVCARAGHEGVAEWLLEAEPHLPDLAFAVRSMHEEAGTVIVVGRAEQRDGAAQPWEGWDRVHIWTVQDGLILKAVEYDATV